MLQRTPDRQHRMAMVHPSSMHNLLLRYWLAAGGIDPDLDLTLQTIPPAQMVVDLRAGSIDGFCVGEPWNQRAAMDGVGFTIATDREIYDGHPGKVLGVREEWANAYPNTHIALTKALLEACRFCAEPERFGRFSPSGPTWPPRWSTSNWVTPAQRSVSATRPYGSTPTTYSSAMAPTAPAAPSTSGT